MRKMRKNDPRPRKSDHNEAFGLQDLGNDFLRAAKNHTDRWGPVWMLVCTHERMLPDPDNQTTMRPLGSRALGMIF